LLLRSVFNFPFFTLSFILSSICPRLSDFQSVMSWQKKSFGQICLALLFEVELKGRKKKKLRLARLAAAPVD